MNHDIGTAKRRFLTYRSLWVRLCELVDRGRKADEDGRPRWEIDQEYAATLAEIRARQAAFDRGTGGGLAA